MTDVVIPTLRRADRLRRLAENIEATADAPHQIVIVAEPDDHDTISEAGRLGLQVHVNQGPPCYSGAMNDAFAATSAPFLFVGADDVEFEPGWLRQLVDVMEAEPTIGIVGTFDPRHPKDDHSDHSLVRRSYVEEFGGCLDDSGPLLHPYKHGFSDHELLGVAKSRSAYVQCTAARVHHHHPGWDHRGRVKNDSPLFDEVYARANANVEADRKLFFERASQWVDLIDQPSPTDLAMREKIHAAGRRGSALRLRVLDAVAWLSKVTRRR